MPSVPSFSGEAILSGWSTMEEALSHPSRTPKAAVWVRGERSKRLDTLRSDLEQRGVRVYALEREAFQERYPFAMREGVVLIWSNTVGADAEVKRWLHDEQMTSGLVLALDGVQDPHNLGACLRTAAVAGVDAVLLPRNHAVGLTPTVRRVASGAAERLRVAYVTNVVRTLRAFQQAGWWVHAAAEGGDVALYDVDFRTTPVVLVAGAEGKGCRALTLSTSDVTYEIPAHGTFSTLNVSVAVGVSLMEAVRQRRHVPNQGH